MAVIRSVSSIVIHLIGINYRSPWFYSIVEWAEAPGPIRTRSRRYKLFPIFFLRKNEYSYVLLSVVFFLLLENRLVAFAYHLAWSVCGIMRRLNLDSYFCFFTVIDSVYITWSIQGGQSKIQTEIIMPILIFGKHFMNYWATPMLVILNGEGNVLFIKFAVQ